MSARRGDKWWVVAAMSLPLFILTVDINGAFIALPEIGLDLEASTTSLQWVMNAYLLAFAALLLPIGRVADLIGRRRMLLAGIVVFGAASLLNGLAPSEAVLIAGRALQGMGAAMFFATSLSIVSNVFPPDERARGIGVWTAVGASGAAAGPILGGVLTEFLSWRWFFLVNVPIAVAAVILTLAVVEESRDTEAEPGIDVAGFITSALGMVALIFGIQEGPDLGWDDPLVIASLIAGPLLLVAFVIIETRVANPLFELELFRGRNFLASNIAGAAQNAAFFTISFFVTLYLQNVEGLGAFETGIVFLAIMIPFISISFFTGKVYERLGGRWGMVVGLAFCGASALALIPLDLDTTLLLVIVSFLLFGVGAALAYNISTTAGMASIPEEKAGGASGILSSTRFVGPALALAATGAVFQAIEDRRLREEVADQVPSLSDAQVDEVQGLLSGSPEAVAELSELGTEEVARLEDIVREVFVPAMSVTMAVIAGIVALGIAGALLYRDRPEQS